MVPEQCTRQPVPIAGRKQRFPSSQLRENQCTVGTATRSIVGIRQKNDGLRRPFFVKIDFLSHFFLSRLSIVTSVRGWGVTQQISWRVGLNCSRFWFKEVSLTPNKRGSFGGYGIELDTNLAKVLGGNEGQKISPSEMTKRLWSYVKRHNLGKKN